MTGCTHSLPVSAAASRARDCLPEPATPTSSAAPRGALIMRAMCIKWWSASLKRISSTACAPCASLKDCILYCTQSRNASKSGIGS
eukprot:scaffold49383_cov27-Tisochrysis_lutea.AAC.13